MTTGNQTERLKKLSPAKRALLLKALAEQSARNAEAESIPRRQQQNRVPLSFAQQRLWLINQLAPGSPAYNVPSSVRLSGALERRALEWSLSEIVSRHEVLRTTFGVVDEQPVQVIAPATDLELEITNLQYLPEDERQAQALRLAAEEACRPFDLSKGPLLRARLLRLFDEEHVLLLTMHHIISDGWSEGVLIGELSALYQSFLSGLPSPPPSLQIQYADYAVWQRQRLQGEVLDELLNYWKRQLAGAPESLSLPTDRPRPPVQTTRGAIHNFTLPRPLSIALKALSRESGGTLFMTLLAAFDVLLHRYTGQDDIVVGTPIAGRNRRETEALIGFFVNTLVLRANLSGNPGFNELLRRIQETTLDAYAHQDVPFEKLVEELQPQRDPSRNPFFQVMFVLQNTPAEVLQQTALHLSSFEVDRGVAKFDLTLSMTENAEGQLSGSVEYNTDLFDATTIERMLRHFHVLLDGIVADPEQRIAHLPLLTDAERHQLLGARNNTRAEFPQSRCLHTLFEQQAARTPDAVALVFDGMKLSYRELNEKANQLAHFLQRRGISQDMLVGILMERSIEMVVAILGVLKAGGAYVPLDPSYPQERLRFMIDDSAVSVLLTQGRLTEFMPESEVRLICVDTQWNEIAREEAGNPASEVTAHNLAYVIYTSGSTGKPKGVMVEHRQVTRLFAATDERLHFSSADVWTLFHSYAFDFSVWELWGALLHGGRLIVVPYLVSRSPETFRLLLVSEAVTVLSQTPSAFRQLVWAEERAVPATGAGELSLRIVIFGGEALDIGGLVGWMKRYGDARPQLINMYGITETTVHVTQHRLRGAEVEAVMERGRSGSPIGVPLDDLRVYVLDMQQEVVPIGVAGELYVTGAGVARGYLNRASLTAERFVPDAFGGEAGARMYRTGDVGRWMENGELEYLGRADDQVKVRGHRIELAEIESVLTSHAEVRETAVLAREEASGEKRLVGYVVTSAAGAVTASELRRYLHEKLPDYMVPSSLVLLESLPVTEQGKVDRGALGKRREETDVESGAEERSYVAPQTAVEELLAEVWREVLRLERVSVEDNFFSLGGDSMRILQVLSRAQERGLNLSAQQIYQHQTIAELAREFETTLGLSEQVEGRGVESQYDEELARILADLEEVSEDDVRVQLRERM